MTPHMQIGWHPHGEPDHRGITQRPEVDASTVCNVATVGPRRHDPSVINGNDNRVPGDAPR